MSNDKLEFFERFAAAMRHKLALNDHKRTDGSVESFFMGLENEVRELRDEVYLLAETRQGKYGHKDYGEMERLYLKLLLEAADVANFALLVAKRAEDELNAVP